MKNKAIIIILSLVVIVSSIFNVLQLSRNNNLNEEYSYTKRVMQNDLATTTRDLKEDKEDTVEVIEQETLKLINEIDALKEIIAEKDLQIIRKNVQISELEEIQVIEQPSDDDSNLYTADNIINSLNMTIENMKVMFMDMEDTNRIQRILGNLILPANAIEGEEICGLEIEEVSLQKIDELENTLYSYNIKFNGEFTLTGILTYDFTEYNTFFIRSEELNNVPYTPKEMKNSKISIAMIDSKEYLEERGYVDGDIITVRLKNLQLSSIAYKPKVNTADFIEIINE